MGNILSDSKTRKYFSCCPVCAICANRSDDLDAISSSKVQNRAATDTVDRHSVYEVSVSVLLPCADITGEETESMWSEGREPKPTDLGTNVDEAAHWKKCYGALWELKIAFEEKNYR